MADFNEIFEELKDNATKLIKLTVSNFKDQAEKDTKKFLEESKDNLERWTRLLINGELSTSEFEFLVESQKDLLVLNALRQSGLAKIRVDHFKNSLLNLIVDTIFNKVL